MVISKDVLFIIVGILVSSIYGIFSSIKIGKKMNRDFGELTRKEKLENLKYFFADLKKSEW